MVVFHYCVPFLICLFFFFLQIFLVGNYTDFISFLSLALFFIFPAKSFFWGGGDYQFYISTYYFKSIRKYIIFKFLEILLVLCSFSILPCSYYVDTRFIIPLEIVSLYNFSYFAGNVCAFLESWFLLLLVFILSFLLNDFLWWLHFLY